MGILIICDYGSTTVLMHLFDSSKTHGKNKNLTMSYCYVRFTANLGRRTIHKNSSMTRYFLSEKPSKYDEENKLETAGKLKTKL